MKAEIIPIEPDPGHAGVGMSSLDQCPAFQEVLFKTFYMKTKILLALVGLALSQQVLSQTKTGKDRSDTAKVVRFSESALVITSSRVNDRMPIAVSNLNKKEIDRLNYGQDIPFLLQQMPSVVVFSDAGAGVGYTGLRVRGSDASRINVTLNGLPVNDAESQAVFFVNMPDLASSLGNIQLQRGVGTSSNGAGAFGASLNLELAAPSDTAFADYTLGMGSFNTWRNALRFGSGKLKSGWNLEGRLSKISSDGFIDRAFSNLQSAYLSASRVTGRSSFRINAMFGNERTYQAWNGVPQDSLATNPRYNTFTYDNQTDNYWQNFYQAFYSYKINSQFELRLAGFYTRGRGFYEEYRTGESFKLYKMPEIVLGNDTIRETDLVRRRWLDNDNYGGTATLAYQKNQTEILGGLMYSVYEGRHFGEVIWARMAGATEIRHPFYQGYSNKRDVTAFVKLTQTIARNWDLFADLQYRGIQYKLFGEDPLNGALFQYGHDLNWQFLNPKVGMKFRPAMGHEIHGYAGIANREPVRNDIINATTNSIPKAETLYNFELGYQLKKYRYNVSVNFYWMEYVDQLVNDGSINDVGAYNRINVGSSYRAGVEFQADYRFSKRLTAFTNATFSENKIRHFDEFADKFDADWNYLGNQLVKKHHGVDLAFSPALTAMLGVRWMPFDGFAAELVGRHVSSQYLDNTASADRMLDAFTVLDIRMSWDAPAFMGLKGLRFGVQVNNLTNQIFAPNGYTYGWFEGSRRANYNFVFPQAGTNVLGSVMVRL